MNSQSQIKPVPTAAKTVVSADELQSQLTGAGLDEPTRYFIVLVGEPDSGKTRQAFTFPACYWVGMGDTYGWQVLKQPENAHLAANCLHRERFQFSPERNPDALKAEAKELFRYTDNPQDRTSLFGVMAHVRQLAKAKLIQTFIFDGGSFWSDFKSAEIGRGNAPSKDEVWAYYRQLKTDMVWFFNRQIMPLVENEYGLNVVLTFHIHRQTDEQKERQTQKDVDMLPRIEGSFREIVNALPRSMIYLHVKAATIGADGKVTLPEYFAYCKKVRVGGLGVVPAKNTYSLPPILPLTNKDLYQELLRYGQSKPK
jgi:hypothetical protein